MKKLWKGTLRRADDGTYAGELVDDWGWRLVLKASVVEGPGGRHFAIEAEPSYEVPKALRIPALDDEPKP